MSKVKWLKVAVGVYQEDIYACFLDGIQYIYHQGDSRGLIRSHVGYVDEEGDKSNHISFVANMEDAEIVVKDYHANNFHSKYVKSIENIKHETQANF